MEIRGPGDSHPPVRTGRPAVPPGPGQAATASAAGRDPGDAFQRAAGEASAEVPFWLIAMSADRAAGRQFLDEKARRAARQAERAWIASWAAAASLPAPPAGAAGKAALQTWQAFVADLCATAGVAIGSPQVVWQPALGAAAPARGQYLFRADGGLLQLRPGGAGEPGEWVATVAHETFHHAQHALVVALYRGSPALEPPFDALAAYYRDARIAYRLPGPTLSPAAHARQDLEVGAWAFGAAMARRLVKG